MSLERELVYQLRKEGNSEADVLEIIAMMGDPDILKTKPVKLNPKLVDVTLSQYNAAEELKKRKDYVKKDREKLKELIEEKEEEIRNTRENLLSVRVSKDDSIECKNCFHISLRKYYARIIYLNGQGGIPTRVEKEKNLFYHCSKCGYTKEIHKT